MSQKTRLLRQNIKQLAGSASPVPQWPTRRATPCQQGAHTAASSAPMSAPAASALGTGSIGSHSQPSSGLIFPGRSRAPALPCGPSCGEAERIAGPGSAGPDRAGGRRGGCSDNPRACMPATAARHCRLAFSDRDTTCCSAKFLS